MTSTLVELCGSVHDSRQLGGPPDRPVIGHGDLRAVHVDRIRPGVVGEPVQQPPERGDALGADRDSTPAARSPALPLGLTQGKGEIILGDVMSR